MMGQAGFYLWQGDTLKLKVRITAPPIEGRVNAHLIRFPAGVFTILRARIMLASGKKGRSKQLRIEAPARLPDIICGKQN